MNEVEVTALIEKMLVNRADNTLELGVNGIPISEAWTHTLAVDNFIEGMKGVPKDSIYDLMAKGNPSASGKTFHKLFEDVLKNGIKDPVTAYDLGDGWYEIYGGHHRLALAVSLKKSFKIESPIPLDPFFRGKIDTVGMIPILAAYSNCSKEESLREGQSYNSFPGLNCIRKGHDRLQMIYRAIIDAKGKWLLDLGSNDGFFSTALSMMYFIVRSVERSKAYCEIIKQKHIALKHAYPKREIVHGIVNADISEELKRLRDSDKALYPSVVIYMDVFYHTLREKGLDIAEWDLVRAITVAKEYLIFSPGRWDKLIPHGFTEMRMHEIVQNARKRIKYLGKDNDGKGYGREVFLIY